MKDRDMLENLYEMIRYLVGMAVFIGAVIGWYAFCGKQFPTAKYVPILGLIGIFAVLYIIANP